MTKRSRQADAPPVHPELFHRAAASAHEFDQNRVASGPQFCCPHSTEVDIVAVNVESTCPFEQHKVRLSERMRPFAAGKEGSLDRYYTAEVAGH